MTSPGPHMSGCPRNTEGATGLEVGGARGTVGDEGGSHQAHPEPPGPSVLLSVWGSPWSQRSWEAGRDFEQRNHVLT